MEPSFVERCSTEGIETSGQFAPVLETRALETQPARVRIQAVYTAHQCRWTPGADRACCYLACATMEGDSSYAGSLCAASLSARCLTSGRGCHPGGEQKRADWSTVVDDRAVGATSLVALLSRGQWSHRLPAHCASPIAARHRAHLEVTHIASVMSAGNRGQHRAHPGVCVCIKKG